MLRLESYAEILHARKLAAKPLNTATRLTKNELLMMLLGQDSSGRRVQAPSQSMGEQVQAQHRESAMQDNIDK